MITFIVIKSLASLSLLSAPWDVDGLFSIKSFQKKDYVPWILFDLKQTSSIHRVDILPNQYIEGKYENDLNKINAENFNLWQLKVHHQLSHDGKRS